jgi:mitochondrial cardiolipin hydrolase
MNTKTPAAATLEELLELLAQTIEDARLSDEEKRTLTHALRQASPSEEGLRQLRNRAFDLVREHTQGTEQLDRLKWLEGVVRALDITRSPTVARTNAYFSPGPHCLQTIVGQLRSTKRQVDICVFTLSDDRITVEVLAALKRGVALRLITDNDKEFDHGSDVEQLRHAGVPVVVDRTDAHMHHKFAIFDNTWLINGSYNWTRSASQYNEENMVLTNHPTLVTQFAAQFQALWTALQ